MRFIETKRLNDYILSTGSFFRNTTAEDFVQRLDDLKIASLQGFSIAHDQDFLHEVSAVLSVIVSIIYHPHISNQREEVVIRIEQAQQIGQEAFLATLKDSKLWKEHGNRMIPEEVYYHQHIDELRIYENRFIGFLVDLIDKELSKYSTFYLSRLPTLTAAHNALEGGQIGEVVMEIDRLKRKTQFIKNTYFYKEVTRGKPISHKIQPTNILLKDRLYRFCFRFYRSLARYEDSYATKRDLRAYYMILLFKELMRLGYRPTAVQNGKYQFEGRDFLLTVAAVEHEALSLKVEYRNLPAHPARHLLAFHVETEHRISEVRPEDADRYEGAEVLSLWELCYADTDAPAGIRIDTERELINAWLAEKLSRMPADRLVYQKYCPVCGYRGVDTEKDVYACPACSSRYMFDECEGHVHVWFRKIRKRVIS